MDDEVDCDRLFEVVEPGETLNAVAAGMAKKFRSYDQYQWRVQAVNAPMAHNATGAATLRVPQRSALSGGFEGAQQRRTVTPITHMMPDISLPEGCTVP